MVWSVNGNDIEAQKLNDTDFSVKIASGSIPQEVIDAVAAGRPHLELDFAHSGEFGFTAALSYCIGKAAGSGVWANGQQSGETYANLFAYDPLLRRLDFVCAGKVGDDGTVSLPLSRASDGTLILSDAPMGGNETPPQLPSVPPEGTVPENPQEPGETEPAQVKSVKLSKTVYTYNGKAKKPSVIAVDTDGRRISSRYYKVSYKNNQKVGKATAEITFSGGYTGKVKKTFTIRPAGTSIKGIKADPAGFTVTWKKKTAQTNGCQVQYSLDADFKGSSTHSRFTKKASQTKKSVKRLEAGKTYYVRIRTYKAGKTGGKSAWTFSGWSSPVRVKCLGTQGAVGY